MRILDKYLIKHIAAVYLFVLLIFTGLFLIIDAFSSLSDILKARTPLNVLLQYYFYSLPLIIKTVSPLSLLISNLYVLGEINKNNEIISFRVSGITVLRLSLPAIFLSLLISCSLFFTQEKLLLPSQKKVEYIKMRFIKKDLKPTTRMQFSSGNMVFYAKEFSPKEKMLKNVDITENDEKGNSVKSIKCETITYEYGLWIARDVVEYNLDNKGRPVSEPLTWKTKKININKDPQELASGESSFFHFFSLKNLKRDIHDLKNDKKGKMLSKKIINYHQNIIDPFSHIFLTIGILPIALEIKRRKVALSSLGIGLIYYILYYFLYTISVTMGNAGIILPALSAWLAPFFILSIGISGLILIK